MPRPERYIGLNVIPLAHTEKAVKVSLPDDEEVWFPFSQIDEESIPDLFDQGELRKGAEIRISVTEWICKQKGII